MHKNTIGSKLQPIVSKEEIEKGCEKEGKVPLYLYFHPHASELWESILAKWAFVLKFSNKNAEKCIKTIGSKLLSTVSEKRKLREVVRKGGKVPLYPYFCPQTLESWESLLAEWTFALKFQIYGEMWLASFEFDYGLLYWVLGALSTGF